MKIRVTEELLARLKARAASEGRSLNAYITRILEIVPSRKDEPTRTPDPDQQKLLAEFKRNRGMQ
jgi:plasmid stability protein